MRWPSVEFSILGISKLIARKDTWRPLCHQKKKESISHLLLPEPENSFLSRRPLRAAVPTIVVVRSIVIVLSITLIMFPVIRNQVIERKAGMICDRIVLVIVLA